MARSSASTTTWTTTRPSKPWGCGRNPGARNPRRRLSRIAASLRDDRHLRSGSKHRRTSARPLAFSAARSVRLSALTAPEANLRFEISHQHQRLLHRTWLDAPGVPSIWVVEEIHDRQARGYHAGHYGDQQALDSQPLARVGHPELERDRHAATKQERQPQRRWHRWAGLAESFQTAGGAGGGLVEELLKAKLLTRRAQIQSREHRPVRFDPVVHEPARVPLCHRGPLLVYDRASVANEISTQLVALGTRKECRGARHVQHRRRFGLRTGLGGIVRLESSQNHKREHDRQQRSRD